MVIRANGVIIIHVLMQGKENRNSKPAHMHVVSEITGTGGSKASIFKNIYVCKIYFATLGNFSPLNCFKDVIKNIASKWFYLFVFHISHNDAQIS